MCGILGITGTTPVAQDLYDGLVMLQHRGQDAAGIVTFDTRFNLKKGNGLVSEVFRTKNMLRLRGNIGIAHVRYPTAGCYSDEEAQPFYVNAPFGITLVHNGNLTNAEELAKELKNHRHLNTPSDSEILLNILADELAQTKNQNLTLDKIFTAADGVFKRTKGSFAALALIAHTGLLAFRDPHGIRPLVFGERFNGFQKEYAFASENVALSALGFKFVRDVAPGEAIFVDLKGNFYSKVVAGKNLAPCIFEYVYLARTDSLLDDISVYKSRLRMGEYLAEKIKKRKIDLDIVVPVPESGRSAALMLAHTLGVRYREGLLKNRYIGRTFIMPGQTIRKKSIRHKLSVLELEFRDKNVLLVDDSIVRGNTSAKIEEMVRGAGAKKVYLASCAPPLKYPCPYGVDMPTRKEFIANNLTIEQIEHVLNVDGLFYQTMEDLTASVQEGNPKIKNFCTACFSGKYPTPEVTEEYLQKIERLRIDEVKSARDDEEQLSLL